MESMERDMRSAESDLGSIRDELRVLDEKIDHRTPSRERKMEHHFRVLPEGLMRDRESLDDERHRH